jgi:hypothetical protein
MKASKSGKANRTAPPTRTAGSSPAFTNRSTVVGETFNKAAAVLLRISGAVNATQLITILQSFRADAFRQPTLSTVSDFLPSQAAVSNYRQKAQKAIFAQGRKTKNSKIVAFRTVPIPNP